jgi:MSHA biogenesis protein MshE
MAGLDISERRLPQDGRFNIKLKNKTMDVRFSTMPTQYGEAVVMRLLDHAEGVKKLDQIGLTPLVRARLEKAIHRPHGLLLVTGPTGSGKTTTLYAALTELNSPEVKIITVEDPVEYRLPRINQVQVNPKIGLDFARVLRSTLRQDPDIILVGEIRDAETAEIALRAAITGHLVMSTLHTNDAVSTAIRLIDMGVEGFLVASAVHAIVAQRLVRRICDKCAADHQPDAGESAWLLNTAGAERASALHFKQGKGCPACGRTGYKGRVAVHELLEITEPLADALRNEDYVAFKTLANQQEGFVPLVDSALALAAEGVTTLEEVIRVGGWVE